MTKRSTTHATFVIEREYPHPPAKVFAAFADPKKKARWFGGPDNWEKSNYKLDFRVGGNESISGGPVGGTVHAYDAKIWDIVENERIVLAYDLHLDATRISVSLATTEIKPSAKGTRLIYTEQGVYLDGYDDAGQREEGTQQLFNQLEAFLNT
ncbi:MAG: SRPBCC family protein [Alphaproteobacteria bacterium]|nr:SRPBCC family protein [Alphaproteobacteria bacterium]